MAELVHQYYLGERQFALFCTGLGLVQIIVAGILLRRASASSLRRGMAYAFTGTGLAQTSLSIGYLFIVANKAQEALRTYAGLADSEIRQFEIARMTGILSTGYTGGIALHSLVFITGLVLFLVRRGSAFRKGVSWPMIIAGVAGLNLEGYSILSNHQYLNDVLCWFPY